MKRYSKKYHNLALFHLKERMSFELEINNLCNEKYSLYKLINDCRTIDVFTTIEYEETFKKAKEEITYKSIIKEYIIKEIEKLIKIYNNFKEE